MIMVDGNVMGEFKVVNSFEDCESLSDGLHTNFLEGFLIQAGQYIAGNVMIYGTFRNRAFHEIGDQPLICCSY